MYLLTYFKFGSRLCIQYTISLSLCVLVCEKSRYHVVEETIPSCKQVNITHCYSGIGGEQCSEIPKTECKMVKANITKYFSPDINVRCFLVPQIWQFSTTMRAMLFQCKQVQTNICAAKCEIKFVEQCETFVRQVAMSSSGSSNLNHDEQHFFKGNNLCP